MVLVFAKAGAFADRIVRRWMPDPFVLVLLLSLVALALGFARLRARDIMGFCLVLFVVCLPVLALALTFG